MEKNGVAAVVAANGNPAIAEVLATFKFEFGSYVGSYASGKTAPTAWTAANAATQLITFATGASICDVTKWDSVTACHSVDIPWAHTAFVDYIPVNGLVAAVPGSIKAWHFLGEKGAEMSKNFQIVKDDKINWIV